MWENISNIDFVENRMSDFWGVVVGAGGLGGNGVCGVCMMGNAYGNEGCEKGCDREMWGVGGEEKGYSIPLYLSLLLVPFLSPPCSSLPSLRGRKSVQNENFTPACLNSR